MNDQMKDFLESDFIYWSDMPKDDRKTIFSFGGGVDSTGMLFEFDRQGYMPDILIFADTGGERPDIYAHIKKLNKWLMEKWGKEIIIVRQKETLEAEVLRRKTLPALAMGFHTCSQKHKIRPIAKWLKANGHRNIIKIIGYDANEFDRARRGLTSVENGKNTEEKGIDLKLWFPLIEWSKSRKELKQEINDIGFCASKSSCFYCPAMSLGEVKQLKEFYPDLYKRAIDMEAGALVDDEESYSKQVKTITEFCKDMPQNWYDYDLEQWEDMTVDNLDIDFPKYPKKSTRVGLGRSWNWAAQIEAEESQLSLFDEDSWEDLKGVQTCGCINW